MAVKYHHLNLILDENCILLGYYAVSNGNPLPVFQDNVSFPSSRVKKSKKKNLTIEDGTDTSSRGISKGLPFHAA
jgi:hypothetical protein